VAKVVGFVEAPAHGLDLPLDIRGTAFQKQVWNAIRTIPAGATEDAIATVPATAPPSPHGFPLYNRQLHVTNGLAPTPSAPNPAYSPGGMLTFISG